MNGGKFEQFHHKSGGIKAIEKSFIYVIFMS